MKKRSVACLLAVASIAALVGCGEKRPDENATLVLPEGYTQVSPDPKIGVNTFGASVEFDPHFLSQNVAKGVSTAEDWQIVESRVAKMEIDRFRVMLLPSWLEPFNDNDSTDTVDWDTLTPESAEMRSLYKVLDLAQANGIDVNLTLWGAENNLALIDSATNQAVNAQGGHFLTKGNEGTNWVLGTLYPEEFAENFSIYLQHLFAKGYTCIKEITPINEPNWSYQINKSVDFEQYKTLCFALHDRLTKDGLRDKVLFNLSDNTDTASSWLQSSMEELDEIADVYNSHTYIFGYSTTNAAIAEWEQNNINVVRYTGKPHVVGEFGSNQNIGSSRQSDIDEYRRGVLMVRQMLNFYNAGAAGASYWVLCDQYYNHTDSYDAMMMLGLWRGSKRMYAPDNDYYRTLTEDYQVRPQYYAVSLMTKHVPKGAEVYPVLLNDDFAVGTAFKDGDGKWTYVFANGNAEGEALKLALRNGEAYGEFDRYVYAENALPAGDALIASSGSVKVTGQVLSFELAPQTAVVFKQK